MEFQTLAAMQSLNPKTITTEDFPAKYLFLALDNLKIGMSLIDRRMRFVSVNSSLADMNRLPVEDHAGRSVREVMGVFAAKIWPLVQHVFSTGKTLSDVQVSGKLPNREDVGHWTEWYFPILNKSGLIAQVGVIVMEVRPKPPVDPRMCLSC